MTNRFKLKLNIFTNLLLDISKLSVSRTLKVGCIAFKKDFSKIGAFGYNGTYPGAPVNPETGGEEISLKPGQSGFLHAEENMIAKFKESDPENYIVFVSSSPCRLCAIRLVNAGFKHVYYYKEYRDTLHLKEIFNACEVEYGLIDQIKKFND